jgi:DNA topoisomerase-3
MLRSRLVNLCKLANVSFKSQLVTRPEILEKSAVKLATGPVATTIMKVLNVAEKNDAAKNIAGLLSGGNRAMRNGRSKYNKIYMFQCDVPQLGGRCDMTMTSVSGHLMELDFDESRYGWQKCRPQELFDAPLHEVVGKNAKDIERTLKEEARTHQALIIWTDGDREGENIGFQIIRVCTSANRNMTILRAKFSEITPRAMNTCIRNLVEPDENLSTAVDIRKELDKRFGYAFTRYQTDLLRRTGETQQPGGVVSYGPCQFPTMGFVISRYLEIMRFVPQAFWAIAVTHKKDGLKVAFNWKRRRLFDESACLAFYTKIMECPKAKVTNVVGKRKTNWRPEAMYTTSMEKLASSKLRIPAKEAMTIAEKLYTSGFISYPRTETNIFPKGMNLHNLVEQQVSDQRWGDFASRILREGGPKPRNGKKTDNAHPPIHPTKKGDGLMGREAQLYELIARHFLACVSQDAVGNETTITINMNDEEFTTSGLIIFEKNYLEVYPYFKWNAKEVPRYLANEEFVPESVMMNESKTTPPLLLTESDLISLMEKHGIGTDATHAEHIHTIQQRNYVKKLPRNSRFCPTKLGLALYDGYSAMQFAHLIKPNLRARLEGDLVKISESRRNAREVADEYISEHKVIYQIVDRDRDKLVHAFSTNKNMPEPELRLRTQYPADY